MNHWHVWNKTGDISDVIAKTSKTKRNEAMDTIALLVTSLYEAALWDIFLIIKVTDIGMAKKRASKIKSSCEDTSYSVD